MNTQPYNETLQGRVGRSSLAMLQSPATIFKMAAGQPDKKRMWGTENFNHPTNISYSGSLDLLPLLFKNQNGDFLFLILPVSSTCTSGVK